jgi:fatty-acyl-CoA synthase
VAAAAWDRWVPSYSADSFTLHNVLEERMATRPHKETYHYMRTAHPVRWSNQDFQQHAEAMANGLTTLGYKRGAKLAVWAGNDMELPTVLTGLGLTGNHMVGIDPELSVDSVKEVLGDLGCRGLLFAPRWGGEQRNELMTEIVPDLDDSTKHLGRCVYHKPMRHLRHLIDLRLQNTPGVLTLAQVPVYDSEVSVLPEARRVIHASWPLFTSVRSNGEGGWTVGKTLSVADAIEFGRKFSKTASLTPDSTVMITAPFHTALAACGATLGALTAGAKIVMVKSVFDAKASLETLARQRVTTLVATAEQLAAMEEVLKADADSRLSAPFLNLVVADTAFSAKGATPSTFAGASVVAADSSRDNSAL